MFNTERTQGKNSLLSSSTSVENSLFRKRPFFNPEDLEKVSPQKQKLPDLQAQMERGARFKDSLSRMKVYGNRPEIQPKLAIGVPGDKYELEADQMATAVVNQINAPVTQQSGQNLQREEMSEEDELHLKYETETIPREEIPEEELQMKPMLQLQSGVGGMAATSDLESSIQQAPSSGQPLADNICKPMEQAFGADFSGVKVHTDAQSDQLNRSIQARAFTTGQDVFFRQGAYEPGSRGGQELIAHELTHVVQQNGRAVQRSLQPPKQLQQPPTVSGIAAEVIQRNEDKALEQVFEQTNRNIKKDNFEEVKGLFDQNEKDYRGILKAYDNNWFTMKEHLAYTKYAKDKKEYDQRMNIMEDLLHYRKEETQKILEPVMLETAKKIPKKEDHGGSTEFKEIEGDKGYKIVADSKDLISALAPGSQTLTSDIDITFNVPGNEHYEIDLVKEFNSKFRNKWGLSSGIVFDVNAYTSGFMSKASGHLPAEGNQQTLKNLLGEEQKKDVKATKHLTQMALGFLSIRKYFAEKTKEWDTFKDGIGSTLEKYLEEKSIPEEVQSEAQNDVNAICKKTEALYDKTKQALSNKQNDIKESRQNEKLSEPHVNALAGDQLYEDQLDKIRNLLKNRQDLVKNLEAKNLAEEDLKGLQSKLAENMNNFEVEQGEALVYANEAYYTAGAAIHVVKGMQGGSSITLGRQQQMASVLMNIGYKLMHYEHNFKEGGQGRALVATAKYGDRIRDLVKQGQGENLGGRETTYKKDVDPELYNLLSKDMEVLENEKNLIDKYKKSKALTSPATKEASAENDLGKEMLPDKIEITYLKIAQSVLGPFYANKYESAKSKEKENKLWQSHQGK